MSGYQPLDRPASRTHELRTYIGKKPTALSVKGPPNGDTDLLTKLAPNLKLETPIMIGHMSYGAISLNAQTALAKAVTKVGTFMGTGEEDSTSRSTRTRVI